MTNQRIFAGMLVLIVAYGTGCATGSTRFTREGGSIGASAGAGLGALPGIVMGDTRIAIAGAAAGAAIGSAVGVGVARQKEGFPLDDEFDDLEMSEVETESGRTIKMVRVELDRDRHVDVPLKKYRLAEDYCENSRRVQSVDLVYRDEVEEDCIGWYFADGPGRRWLGRGGW